MKTKIPCLLAIVWCLAVSAPAQTAPPAPAAGAEEKPIVMETFTVSADKDNGYIAVDSLAGGRSNTPIKLTPSAMSSLTRAFLDDVGIQNVREALKWTANVVPSDLYVGKQLANPFNSWDYNFRGAGQSLQGGMGPTQNYFPFFQNQDGYNIERIEFDRGPNSILFGVGTVGGTVSTYTKVPRTDRDFFTPTVILDSNNSMRYEMDFNRRLTDKVTMRLNALFDRNRGWRNNDKNDKQAVDLSLLYRPTADTTLRVEGEYSKAENTLISTFYADKASGWDGTTASNTWGASPAGSARTEHMQNAGAWGDWLNPFWVYIPGLGSKSLMAWAGGWASTTSQTETWAALTVQPYAGWYPSKVKLPWHSDYVSTAKVPVLPGRDFTYGSGISKPSYKDGTVFLDHRFGETLDGELAYYRYSDDQTAKDYEGTGGVAIDINKQLPDGTTNPNFGKPFADFFLSKQWQHRSVSELRAQLNYHFDSTLFGAAWKQLVSVSAGTQKLDYSARQYLGQVGNGTTITNPADWVQNMIWGRIYFDHPNQTMNPPEVAPNGRQISYLPKADGYWYDFDESRKLDDIAVVSHSRFLDDKLSVLVGARNDRYTHHNERLRAGPGLSTQVINDSASGNTYSAGAIYYFNWFGIFANYSKNFEPVGSGWQPFLDGSTPGPATGKGADYGFRISSGDGKYYATIGRYDTKSDGRVVGTPVGLGNIWSQYYAAKNITPDSSKTNLSYSDTQALSVSGYELDLVANPTKNLRLQLNYTKPDSKITNSFPGARAYLAANLATWTSVSNGNLQAAIADAQNTLAQNTAGMTKQGLVDYTASLFANYTFTGDTLKGFSIGGGVAYSGKSYAGILDNKIYFGSPVTSTSAVLAYETKVGRFPARFALNIDNVLDQVSPIVTSYHWGYTGTDGTHIPDSYYLPAPRLFKFSARFTF